MKVLILGGSGHVGGRLLQIMAGDAQYRPTGASRSAPSHGLPGIQFLQLNTCDVPALTQALEGFDAVVNCVAGNAQSIAQGAQALVTAAQLAGYPRIIHLSTMSVYGRAEGTVREDATLSPELGWYGRAKCEAEDSIRAYARQGGSAVVLRPGCVFGSRSELWVGRIARWLQAGRLGDLGAAGDGWSNLVHIDDVCKAVLAALSLHIGAHEQPVFNLAAPDSPRWNTYFVDLSVALHCTPVKRITARQLKIDAYLAGPPLKVANLLFKRLHWPTSALPDCMPPGLTALWAQHIRLDAAEAGRQLGLGWTTYVDGLQSSAAWAARSTTEPPIKGAAKWTR